MAKICNNCAQEQADDAPLCTFCGSQLPMQQYPPQQQYAAPPQQQYAAPPQQQYPAVPAVQQPMQPIPQYPMQPVPSKYAVPVPRQYAPQPQYQQPPPQQYPQQYPPQPQQYAVPIASVQQPQQYPPQQQYPGQGYYAPVAAKKKGSAGKVILTLTLLIVLLAGIGVALFFFLGGSSNTPEGAAITWIDSVLDGDIEKALNNTALGNEMLELAIRQGLATSKQDALRIMEESMFGSVGNSLVSAGMSLLDIKFSATTGTELSASNFDRVMRDLRNLATSGDAIFEEAVLTLCESITVIYQVGIGVSILGFDLPLDQLLSLYITQIDGKWMVLPIGF